MKTILIIFLLVIQNGLRAQENQIPLDAIDIPTSSEINQLVSPKKAECIDIQKIEKLPVPKERLGECYKKFPSLMNILFFVLDKDFLDGDKRKTRRLDFIIEMNKDVDSYRKCSEDILQYSKENNPPKDQTYFEQRLGEVFSVLDSL